MKKSIVVLMSLIMIFSLVGCGSTDTQATGDPDVKVITDILGREVEVPTKIESVGSLGVMRVLTYMEATDLIVGGTNMDNVNELLRPYTLVNPDSVNLTLIGQGGAGGIVPFHEEIIKVNPDVIFIDSNYPQPDDLFEKTGIPVVAISNPELFDDVMEQSVNIIGEVLNKQERAKEINDFMNHAKNDLNDRTKDIQEEDKVNVYNGALNFRGRHGFDGTSAKYKPFMAINANNVADQTEQNGAFNVDLEKVLEWNPEIIFLNPENMDLVNEQYNQNPDFFNSLDAVKEGEIYTQLPYNHNYTNIEIALVNTYYAGTVIYPENFADINIDEKADEIFKFFLGIEIYQDFIDAGQGYEKLTIGN